MTPKTLRADSAINDLNIALPPAEALTPPPGAEGMRVTPGRIAVEGAFSEVAGEVDALVRSIEGRPITLADLYRVASSIEAIHAAHGFVLARATVPPQRIADGGTVTILVVDGFIESIDTAAIPRQVRGAVAARLASLRDRPQLAIGQIERQLLVAGEVAGITLRSTLSRGKRPGGVQLIVDGSWRKVRGIVRGDNMLDRSLGNASSSLQLSLNSLLGLGETIYGYGATSNPLRPFARRTRVRVLGAGFVIAPGDGRLTLNPEAVLSRTLPTAPADVPRSEGRLSRYALRAGYLLGATRLGRLALDLSLEALDHRTTAIDFSTDLARDHYAAARIGASAAKAGQQASWSLAAQLGQGLGSLDTDNAIPATRQGATATFTKGTAQARGTLAAGPRLTLRGTAFAQTSLGRPLLRAEQFQLEGSDAVSAFVGGVTTVDEGLTARVEGRGRLVVRPLVLAPYLFTAAGYGRIARPTAVEVRHLGAAAIGAGLRTLILEGRAELGVEYAYGIATLPNLAGQQRLNLAASIWF